MLNLTGAGPATAGSTQVPSGPEPVSAHRTSSGFFRVVFDGGVTAATPDGWSLMVNFAPYEILSVTNLGTELAFEVPTDPGLQPGDFVTCSYDGTGDTTGDPGGAPVAAFSDFPVDTE